MSQQIVTKMEIAALCFICGLLISSVATVMTFTPQTPQLKQNVFIFYDSFNGMETLASHNIRTNISEELVRDIMGFNNVTAQNATKWLSLSNDASPLVTWTKLPNEVNANGFERKEASVVKWMNGTDYAYNLTATWSATADQTLQAAGVQWSGVPLSDNNLYAITSFTQTTFHYYDAQNYENVTIVWVLTYDFN